MTDLATALATVTEDAASGNVSTGLDFLVEQAILSKDPAQCYTQAILRAAAAAKGSEQRQAVARLKLAYGKDFSPIRFNADVKEIKAELTRVDAPSRLIVSDNGSPKAILANAITELQNHVTLGFDSFSSSVTNLKPSPWGTSGPWRDLDDVAAANYLQHAGVTVGSVVAHEAAYYLAYQNEYHPVRDWLSGLKWDGNPRLDLLHSHYLGCPDTPYAQQACEFWMISAVARIMRPGCIAKYMIVLEGHQDEGKSKSLRALANGHLDGDSGIQWFRDRMPDINHKDIGMYMQGVWIIEVAELSAIQRREWESTKAFISSPRDTFRVPFGRNMQDYPRQCVFAGTTNEDQWGGDQTGLTRFWPLRPWRLDIDKILRDRDQLWAEARTLYDEGRPWYGDKEFDKLARAEQDLRAPEDVWADRIAIACEALLLGFGTTDVSVNEIMDKLNVSDEKRAGTGPIIGRTLIRLGWELFETTKTANRGRRYRKME